MRRQRLQTALKRLGERYDWQDIGEAEYKEQRAEIRAKLAELPPAQDSNLLAFDRAAATLLPFAEIVRDATLEHQRDIVRHIIDRVVIGDRDVDSIEVRMEARPFFADRCCSGAPGRIRTADAQLRRAAALIH